MACGALHFGRSIVAAAFLASALAPAVAAESRLDRIVSGFVSEILPKSVVKKARKARPQKVARRNAQDFTLPQTAPVPTVAPDTRPKAEPAVLKSEQALPVEVTAYAPLREPPLPTPMPDDLAKARVEKEPAADNSADSSEEPILASIPVPQWRPDFSGKSDREEKRAPAYSDPAGATRATTPAEETACRIELRKLGVEFEDATSLSDPAGCFIAQPIKVTALGKGISLRPAGMMNCAMAKAAAAFMQKTAAPELKSAFGSDLKAVNHASAYVCRPRNGTAKLSEHAFGNALDIASFELADKRTIEVRKSADDTEANALAAMRSAACGPFKTVLGPGNADHDTHFHLDLQPRRNGSTYCR